ncbi:MerR family transcriptional regulator [Fontibacillus phaseoli]|uniref:MerR family transcriptional regulator n=1 Tax=Fontibacillus phaseoli TaxID=1416533 RepID=A0A369BQW6_9BACL|nr:MerR family transcriptional regulator [Fontibacillus phaseoli]RCX23445.1 MerR family transcriptional regulator [Fontibacillus phaseoli]
MQIKEVCEVCRLTRKAVEYYEKQGLITPETAENGYRIYSEKEVKALQEIAVLRSLGIGVADIADIMESKDKKAVLEKCRQQTKADLQVRASRLAGIERLIEDYAYVHIAASSRNQGDEEEELLSIKERLRNAFPGYYGLYLSIHFGRFLDQPAKTREQKEAYTHIVTFLDHLPELHFPAEIRGWLDPFDNMTPSEIEDMQSAVNVKLENIEDYLEDHKHEISEYLRFRQSEPFKQSPAYLFQQQLVQFQQAQGYYEVFIPNMVILSPSYREYTESLNKANEYFLQKFPGITSEPEK